MLSAAELVIRQLRTQNAIPPVAAMLVGYCSAGRSQASQQLVAAVAGITFIMFFATLQNDATDYALDNAGKRHAPLNQGQLPLRRLQQVRLLLLCAACACVLLTGNLLSCGLFALFLLLIWAYNQPPVQLSYRPLLSILSLGLLLSTIPFAIGLSLATPHGRYGASVLLVAVGLFLHRIAVSCIKDYKDYAEDKQFSKTTFVLRYGGLATKQFSRACAALGTAMVVVVLLMGGMSLASHLLLAAGVAVAVYMLALRQQLGIQVASYRANSILFQKIFELSLYFDLLVATCLYTL